MVRLQSAVLGCAYFFDVLKPCSIIVRKVLQEEDVCVVRAAESLIKVKKDFDMKKTVKFHDLPTVKKVIDRIKTHDGIKTYQEAEVKYDMSLSFIKRSVRNT